MRSRPKTSLPNSSSPPSPHTSVVDAAAASPTPAFYTTMHGKPHRLFCELIMPLAHDTVYPRLPAMTSFVYTEEEILASVLSRIDKKCPQLYKDKDKFMRTVERIVYCKEGRFGVDLITSS